MTPVVRALLIANVAVFFLQMTVGGISQLFAFVPAYVLVRPWTIVTYMFLHGGFGHIFFNMLALFFFGPQTEARLGSRRFTALYFIGGITGALFQMVLAPGGAMVGASAGVFAVGLAFAYYWPDAPIYIWGVLPIPARLLVIGYTLYSLWAGFSGRGGGVAHFAHLGGYAGAFIYLKWIERKAGQFRKKATAPVRTEDTRLTKWKEVDRGRIHEVNREEVDRILDKISAQGVGSLTPQERTFLSHFVPPDDRKTPIQ